MLEIGTGSGYQSAYLSHLTDKVFTIEIIKPLAERTRATYDCAHQGRLRRVQGDLLEERRRLLRLGGERAVRQDHRDLRHRPRAAAAAAAVEGRRHDGHPGRARPARSACLKVVKTKGGGWNDHRFALRHLQWPHRALRAVHQARRRRHQGHAQQLTFSWGRRIRCGLPGACSEAAVSRPRSPSDRLCLGKARSEEPAVADLRESDISC